MTERELLERALRRLRRALQRGTGTSLSAEEVRVVGGLLYALGSSVLPGGGVREACAVCGRPEHPAGRVGSFPRHPYRPGVLVPLFDEADAE